MYGGQFALLACTLSLSPFGVIEHRDTRFESALAISNYGNVAAATDRLDSKRTIGQRQEVRAL